MSIPQPVLEAAIAALELHAQHPGTGALHDPIYGMLQGDSGQLELLSAAMLAQSGHPASGALRELLGPYIEVPVPTVEAVLLRHGGVAGEDVVLQVDQMLTEADQARRVLSARVHALEAQAGALGRTANGMAAVGALIAVFGMIGWLVALGWLEIAWIEPAVPQDLDGAAAGRGTVSPEHQGVKR